MSVGNLNNVATQDAYVDALTVEFPFPRPAFSANVTNAAVFYQLAIIAPGGRDSAWHPLEHVQTPAYLNFRDPESEGFPPNTKFAGIRFRSAAAGVPAQVSVA